jgi:hypothetical protein
VVSLELKVMYGALDVCSSGCVGVAGGRSIVWESSSDSRLCFLDFALGVMVVRVGSMDANEVIM